MVVAAIASTAWMASSLNHSIPRMASETENLMAASDLERSLQTHNRLSNLFAATGEEGFNSLRADREQTIGALLAQARATAGTPREVAVAADATARIDRYFARRRSIEESAVGLSDLVRLTRRDFDKALASVKALREINEQDLRDANSEATRAEQLGLALGLAAGVLLFGGLTGAVLALRSHVIQPTLDLHRAINRFRRGETTARAPERGARELTEMSSAFNEMAEALLRQKQSELAFLAGVVHDLKNPLTAMSVSIRALEMRQGVDTDRAMKVLHRQIQRLNRMADDLLDASRIESGQLKLEVEELDLRGLVKDVVDLYAPAYSSHRLAVAVPEQPVVVWADRTRIEQVVGNLVNNAIKFSPDGGEIEVALESSADDACLRVTDRGIGMSPAQMDDLFVPFRRLGPDAVPGSGLGLSVVRRIVVGHEGRLQVESTPGAGSTFRVWIPRRAPGDRSS